MNFINDLPIYLTFDDLSLLPRHNHGTPENISLKTQVTKNFQLNLPLLSAGMPSITEADLAIAMGEFGGLGVIHRYMDIARQCSIVTKVSSYIPNQEIYPQASTQSNGRLITAASVEPMNIDAAKQLVSAGANILFLDTPNPPNEELFNSVATLRKLTDADLVIGSVVETNTAHRYLELGIDGIKIGLGSGALCTMRRTTGVGAPQITALHNCGQIAHQYNVPVISDGGTRTSGDIVKALAVGASTVMLGSLLAGCDETPGEVIEQDGCRMKTVKSLRLSTLEIETPTGFPKIDAYLREHIAPRVEGGDTLVSPNGPCHLTLMRLVKGIRSGIHLAGATSITELWSQARLIRTSFSGMIEASLRQI